MGDREQRTCWQLKRLRTFFVLATISSPADLKQARSPCPSTAASMIPRAPSLFHLEEGVGSTAAASTSTPAAAAASRGDDLVGLRLIIQQSPRRQLPTVLRRSAVRIPVPPATTKCHRSDGQGFVGLEFLKRCFGCHRDMDATTMDVFVYKGEQAFCSAECRCRHIAREERREIEALVRKRRDAFHRRHAAVANKMQGSSERHNIIRLQIVTAAR